MDTPSGINDFRNGVAQRNASTPSHATLSSLQKALIEHATVSSRLLFIQDPSVFTNFHHSDESLNNYSTLELSDNMLNNILPNVHLYQLPELAKKRLRLLDFNPCFRKTPHGYEYTPQSLETNFVLEPTIHYSLPKELPKLLSSQGHCAKSDVDSHTMLLDQYEVTRDGPKFELSYEIGAFLSAILSTDLELSSGRLLNREKIQIRLRRAKNNFEASGNMLPYRNNIELLTNSISTFEKLRKKLCSTLLNS